MFNNTEAFDYIGQRLVYYIFVVMIYGFIIFAFRKTNQFYGLNENSDFIDAIYYASIVFTGSGYGEIYPQTLVSKLIILSLSIVKLYIIVMPLQTFPPENFELDKDNTISINDIIEVVDEYNNYNPNSNINNSIV